MSDSNPYFNPNHSLLLRDASKRRPNEAFQTPYQGMVLKARAKPRPITAMDYMVVDRHPGLLNQTGIAVTAAIFFDGTGNNRNNTAQRHMVQQNKQEEDGIRRTGSFEKYGREKDGKTLKDNSYAAGYSNVSILERMNRKRVIPNREVSVYVEGIGTTDDKGDDKPGNALGVNLWWWKTGIKNKVQRGVMLLADRIAQVLQSLEDAYVNQLTIDVFGFSRGSAAARHFISLLHDAKHPLAVRLGTSRAAIHIKFVGIFDTVSSYGVEGTAFEQSNVQELGLALGAVPKKVVHLTAGNEYRRNFSLTDITSSRSVGYQLTLPGVHSNIGGSYGEQEDEVRHLHLEERAALIAQGWYTEQEAPVQQRPIYDEYGNQTGTHQWAVGVRKGLDQDYQFIPLRIMAENAAKEAMSLWPLSGRYAKYAIGASHPLAPVQAAILAQVGQHGSQGRHALKLHDEWNQIPPDTQIGVLALTPQQAIMLRHCYLRRSASIGIQGIGDGRPGMGERRDDHGRPHRKIFLG